MWDKWAFKLDFPFFDKWGVGCILVWMIIVVSVIFYLNFDFILDKHSQIIKSCGSCSYMER